MLQLLFIQYPKSIAAVSCSPVGYRLGAGGIGVWDDGQAGPCMASVHVILGGPAGPFMVHGIGAWRCKWRCAWVVCQMGVG